MNNIIGGIAHVGITVANYERAKKFYGQVLELDFQGEMLMEGERTDRLFGLKGCSVKVAYFNGSNQVGIPPIELICFGDSNKMGNNKLNDICISEVCFNVKDIEEVYDKLSEKGVSFISEPQYFDLTSQGFGKSKAVYFKDSEGNILELIEEMN